MGAAQESPLIYSAADLLAWHGLQEPAPAQAVVFCLQPDLLRRTRRRWRFKPVRSPFGEAYLYQGKAGKLLLAGGFGLGSPAMAIMVELYTIWGVRSFVSLGMAGALQPELQPGEAVVCERALRGEGLSRRHYLPPGECGAVFPPPDYVFADPGLAGEAQRLLSDQKIPYSCGSAWTTDAPLRETRQEIARLRQAGVACVDMEAAALFAASQSLERRALALFVISDRLLEEGWQPPLDMAPVWRGLEGVLGALIPWLAGGAA
jgi:purine-nucleoside phosphorylase